MAPIESWSPPRTAAFAGLGQMGRAMVARVRDAGLDVVGVDPDPAAREAVAADGLAAVPCLSDAGPVDALFVCVPGPRDLEAVISECLASSAPPRLVVNLSTVGAPVAEDQRDRIRAASASCGYVESPISGGVLRAARGQVALLCAADPPACLDAILPTLERIAARVIRFSTIAAASTAKLVNNLAVLSTSLATLEALEWGVRAGLPVGDLFDALAAGTADSYALRSTLTRSVREGDFSRGFAMRLALKDVRLALGAATAAGRQMPFATEVERQLAAGCELGLGDHTFPAVAAAGPEPALGWTHARAGAGEEVVLDGYLDAR